MNTIINVELSADMTLKSWLEYWFEVYAKRTVRGTSSCIMGRTFKRIKNKDKLCISTIYME